MPRQATRRSAGSRYVLSYPAQLVDRETEEVVTDDAKLARCDGIRESFVDFAHHPDLGVSSDIDVRSAIPTLRFDGRTRQLVMEIPFVTSRKPTDADIRRFVAFVSERIDGGWGTNYVFDLPAELDDHGITFDSKPREPLPAPLDIAPLAALVEPWKDHDYQRLSQLSDSDLEALASRLRPHEARMTDYRVGADDAADYLLHTFRNLLHQVHAVLNHRKADRVGVPKVSMDDLDQLDSLPDDVF